MDKTKKVSALRTFIKTEVDKQVNAKLVEILPKLTLEVYQVVKEGLLKEVAVHTGTQPLVPTISNKNDNYYTNTNANKLTTIFNKLKEASPVLKERYDKAVGNDAPSLNKPNISDILGSVKPFSHHELTHGTQ